MSPAKTPLDSLGVQIWPEEAVDRMPDRSQCRRKCSLDELKVAVDERNAELAESKQPPLETDELIGARLYSMRMNDARNLHYWPFPAYCSPPHPTTWSAV